MPHLNERISWNFQMASVDLGIVELGPPYFNGSSISMPADLGASAHSRSKMDVIQGTVQEPRSGR